MSPKDDLFIPTSEILKKLNADEEAPWADWRKGNVEALSAEKLGRILRPYSVSPVQPTEYQAYQQMRAQRQLAQESLQTAEMYQDAAMDWGSWDGWGVGRGRMGHGIGIGGVR